MKSIKTERVHVECPMCKGSGAMMMTSFDTKEPVRTRCGLCDGCGYRVVVKA